MSETLLLRDWAHEDELKASDPAPRWLIKTARSSLERKLLVCDWYFFWGYHDARDGKEYRDGFDGWLQPHQETYQCGRALLALMLSEGFEPPAWPEREECDEVHAWFDDRRRRFPDELLLPKFKGANDAHI